MKNDSDTIWNRTSDLPICSTALNHCATAVLRASFRMFNFSAVFVVVYCSFGILSVLFLKILNTTFPV